MPSARTLRLELRLRVNSQNRSRPSWGLWACALVVLLSAWAKVAGARDAYRVVVIENETPAPLERELEIRLKGELSAVGFEVFSLRRMAGSEPRQAVATQGSEYRPVAVFAAAEESRAGTAGETGSTLRLWLSDRRSVSLELIEREQAFEGSRAASALAVQGVEWLHARLADWRWPTPPPTPLLVPQAPPPAAEAELQLIPALDVGVLFDAATGGAAVTPLLRLSCVEGAEIRAGVGFGGRLSLAGLGMPTVLETSLRQIEVRQSFALLEGIVTLNPLPWLRPFGSLGGGVYHVNVEGAAPAPIVGRSESTYSPLGGLGLGFLVHPVPGWVGKLEAQGLFAVHPTAVEIEGTRVATFGQPLFVFSAGLGVVL